MMAEEDGIKTAVIRANGVRDTSFTRSASRILFDTYDDQKNIYATYRKGIATFLHCFFRVLRCQRRVICPGVG